MHLHLTDRLACPRCGPPFGLILLAERIEERRVLEGSLGCPNCRERYAVRGGFGDLRPPPADEIAPGRAPEPAGRDDAFRLAALLGVAEGPGFVLLLGPGVRLAPGIADLVEGLEVVAVEAALAGWSERSGVNRLAAAERLPFLDRSMRAVALTGDTAGPWLEEAARVLAPLGRLAVESAPADAEPRLGAAGLRVLARQDRELVAQRP